MTDLNTLPATILPHSYPFVLIDKIIEFEKGIRVACLKNVTVNEEFFQGHFKDNPVMPGVLILEAMAQASGLIIGDKKSGAYLARVKDARFKKPVIPGDQLIIKSSLLQCFHPLYVFDAMVYVKEEIVSEAEITLTIV
jgi:beta-hydroxyacyl-ACP dehydratase FabZ